MKRLFAVLMVVTLLLGASRAPGAAAGPAVPDVYSEASGLCPERQAPAPAPRDPAAAARARALLNDTGLLLIVESTNKRVMAFDPITGDLVDPDFVPADPINLSTPIHAMLSADGNSILVSDQIKDVVQQYALDGTYIGVFAPAGGANPNILDNVRGIRVRDDGHLLVTVASGANAHAVAEFDTAGVYLGNFIANGSGGLNSPWDILRRSADWLVDGSGSSAIHRYDLNGGYIANLASINSFPEQMYELPNGNILVADFSGTQQDIVELAADGTLIGVYNVTEISGCRGVYELPNGNILTTTGSGVFEIDRNSNLVSTKMSGVSGRFIQYVPPQAPECTMYLSRAQVNWRPAKPYVRLAGLVEVMGQCGADPFPVEGAEVWGIWTYPDGGSSPEHPFDFGLTESRGWAKDRLRYHMAGLYTICVTNIVKDGLVYDPGANQVDPCQNAVVP